MTTTRLGDRPALGGAKRPEAPAAAPWYGEGLCFECSRCGGCCKGRGRVEVSDVEIAALAGHLGVGEVEFREHYTRAGRKGRVQLADGRGGRCIFYDGRGACAVYDERPRQCRLYPFWPSLLGSPDHWDDEARFCDGIGRGRRRSADEIDVLLKDAGPDL